MKKSPANRYRVYAGIRLVARILSVISLIILMVFITNDFDPAKIENRQLIGLLFFPTGVVIGFVVAWKWEIAGGLTSLLSLFCFYLIYGVLLSGIIPRGLWFFIFTLPAVIFLVSGIYGRIAIADHYSKADKPAPSVGPGS